MMTDKELRDLAQQAVELARKAGADQADAMLEYTRTFTGRIRACVRGVELNAECCIRPCQKGAFDHGV